VRYDPLSHTRHNAGDRSAKVGHEIILVRRYDKPHWIALEGEKNLTFDEAHHAACDVPSYSLLFGYKTLIKMMMSIVVVVVVG